MTGQFFFKPAARPTVADKTAAAAAQIAALRKEIDKLQADQGARLAAQQEQLEILQQKLEPKPRPPANSPPRPRMRRRPPPLIALLRLSRPATPSLSLMSQLPTQRSQPPRGALSQAKHLKWCPPLVRLCQWA